MSRVLDPGSWTPLAPAASCARPVSPHFLPCWPISVAVVELKTLPRKNCAIKQCRIVMTMQTLDTRSRARVLQICIEHRCRLKQNHGKCCKWLWIFRIVAVQNVFWILLHVYFYDLSREKHLLTSLSCLRNEESAVNIIIIIILMAVASLPVDAVLTLLTVLVAMNITGDRLWVWWGEGTMATRGGEHRSLELHHYSGGANTTTRQNGEQPPALLLLCLLFCVKRRVCIA